ncbi:nitroreductase family protein [Ruminococcaceae bacterium CPB6]|jgi:nitroreductase|uniref:Nitroreductase family protein n=1 Tax=Caproicibacterium lactatifermentans TaxID=2666138 RepID=A0A859DRX1_9FIRM|nr:nitroreductase family protein [Caproicibacterium lactatifermentans]ARP49828.1 nitroreductase family protein [Ruminococcaceae bacterium CPB6]QKN24446.1 nitroreductase family protein [Caproicibacterium lactatifermentans]
MDSIFMRTSIRNYQVKPVEPEKLEQLLKAGMAAPSACNQQPWGFYVVQDTVTLRKLSECSPYSACAAHAPAALVLCIRREGLVYAEDAPLDMSACCENILLEAAQLGLGAVWLGVYPQRDRMLSVANALHLPDTLESFAIVPVGYPTATAVQQDRFDRTRIHIV